MTPSFREEHVVMVGWRLFRAIQKGMSPRVAYAQAKYLRVWDITVTVEVDSTEKNRWVTIIVQARSACIITNVSV